jgi:hypothetical protein
MQGDTDVLYPLVLKMLLEALFHSLLQLYLYQGE